MKLVTVLRCLIAAAAFFLDVALVYATPFIPAPALKLISIEINGKAAQQYGPVDIRVLLERKPTSKIFAIGDVIPRGMLFKTPPDTVAVFESINGTVIKLEPNTEFFIDSMLADGREGYTLNFGGIRVNTPKPVTTMFVRYSNAVINAADAEFTIVGNTAIGYKEARINVLRGAVAIEESVAMIDVDNKSLGFATETNFFVKGQSRITTNDREKRKEMKLNSEAARHEFFLEQLKLVPPEISKMGKQIILKNAAMLALRLKSAAEGLAKYQAWLDGDLIDWRAHFLLLRTFARDCAEAKNDQCAFENYKAALDVANKLYPDGLDPDVVYTRFALGVTEEKMLNKLPDKNAPSAFDKHTLQLRARMHDNVDFYPKRVGQFETRYPSSMQQWGLEGNGSLSVLIDVEGNPQKLVVERSPHPAFEAAIVREILSSKFEPATLEGKPVAITVSIPFVFLLNRNIEGQNQVQLKPSEADLEKSKPFTFPKKPSPDAAPELQYDTPPKINVVAPVVYPRELLRNNITGSATVAATMDSEGRVRAVTVLNATRPEFGEATKAMIQAWEFSPALKGRTAIDNVFKIEQKFNRQERDTGFNQRTRELLYELDSVNSDVVEMDKLDARPKALFAPDPFDPIPLSRAEAEDVVLEFFIDPDGGVQLPRIVSAKNKERGWAAATAVKRWIFEVPKVNGKPVFVRRELALGFN